MLHAFSFFGVHHKSCERRLLRIFHSPDAADNFAFRRITGRDYYLQRAALEMRQQHLHPAVGMNPYVLEQGEHRWNRWNRFARAPMPISAFGPVWAFPRNPIRREGPPSRAHIYRGTRARLMENQYAWAQRYEQYQQYQQYVMLASVAGPHPGPQGYPNTGRLVDRSRGSTSSREQREQAMRSIETFFARHSFESISQTLKAGGSAAEQLRGEVETCFRNLSAAITSPSQHDNVQRLLRGLFFDAPGGQFYVWDTSRQRLVTVASVNRDQRLNDLVGAMGSLADSGALTAEQVKQVRAMQSALQKSSEERTKSGSTEMSSLEKQLTGLEQRLKEKPVLEESMKKLKEEVLKIEADKEKTLAAQARVREELTRLQNAEKAAKEEMSQRMQKISEGGGTLEDPAKLITDLNASFKDSIEARAAQMAVLQIQVAVLLKTINGLEGKLKTASDAHARVEARYNALLLVLPKIEKERAALQQRIKEARTKLASR